VVERFVHIEDVRGSNPLSPTIIPAKACQTGAPFAYRRVTGPNLVHSGC
jgi:hypothetical protein